MTGFFRDPEAWKFLDDHIVPRLLAARPAPALVRVWCAGVASGEEAYSTAILLAEAMGMNQFRERTKI